MLEKNKIFYIYGFLILTHKVNVQMIKIIKTKKSSLNIYFDLKIEKTPIPCFICECLFFCASPDAVYTKQIGLLAQNFREKERNLANFVNPYKVPSISLVFLLHMISKLSRLKIQIISLELPKKKSIEKGV